MPFALERRWTVGGGLRFYTQIISFLDFIHESYDLDGGLIASVYDSHPGLNWNGGRLLPPAGHSVMESIRRIRQYNARGIGFNITFSNMLVGPPHLGDADCNRFLDLCEHPLNGVIVSSLQLAEHIRRRYPYYRLIGSICQNMTEPSRIAEASRAFDRLVLHPDLNREHELICSLDASRIEILVNECCVARCPYRREHSEFIARLLLDRSPYVFEDTPYTNVSCRALEEGRARYPPLTLAFSEVEALSQLGIRHFKIQGREHAFEALLQPALRRYVLKDLNVSLARAAAG